MISRRGFLGAGAALGGQGAGTEKRPNVVVFYTDQQRWDSVGAYGSPMELTPNLDRVAREGVRFEHAFTSQPVCAPARSSIQTGKYPTATGVFRNTRALRRDEQTLGYHFGRVGYRTGYIGKWHLADSGEGAVPLEQRGGYDQYWAGANVLELTSGPFQGRIFDAANRAIEFQKYRVDFLTDLAVEFIRREKENPFYLFVSYLEPHHQNNANRFFAPEGYADRYRNNFHVPPDLMPFPGDWKSQLPDYYGIIARIDECFGRVVKTLGEERLEENTILVFTTDHGCHFRTRNSEYKRSCHDGSIRIPLVIRGPGFEPGRLVPELVSIVDLPPTLLEAAGIAVPGAMQGRSLLALAQGRERTWREEIVVQMREEALQRAIRTPRWKYCVFNPDSPGDEAGSGRYTERYLYDLASDPHELVNLVGRGTHRKIADELQGRLIERMVEIGEARAAVSAARFYA